MNLGLGRQIEGRWVSDHSVCSKKTVEIISGILDELYILFE